jgi:RNA polymerase sigma-70 factor, ECF subfamily
MCNAPTAEQLEGCLELYRTELTAYCSRMLASQVDAEDAVQETLVRAWRGFDRFERRASLRSWLYRIAKNVCLDMLDGQERRARPMDFGPARGLGPANVEPPREAAMEKYIADSAVARDSDPAEMAIAHEAVRGAFATVIQQLPARQRAALLLCEVLRWKSTEVAELLDTTVASVNSALQRARAALERRSPRSTDGRPGIDDAQRALLKRYLAAFEAYDIAALTSLIGEDAARSISTYDLS